MTSIWNGSKGRKKSISSTNSIFLN